MALTIPVSRIEEVVDPQEAIFDVPSSLEQVNMA